MTRFFRYSLEHNRPIRLMYMDGEGKLHQVSAVVEKMEGETLHLYIMRPIQRIQIQTGDVLSCDYMKNDEGMA